MASAEEGHEYAVWTAEWMGGMAADVSARGHSLRADEPPESGGEDTGPMPTELLTAALASCMCLSIAWAARKRRVDLPDLEVQVRPVRAPGEPRYARYEVSVHSSADPEGLRPVVDLGARYCWVTNTLSEGAEVAHRIGAEGEWSGSVARSNREV